ncbi:MAG: hypothetical protein IKU43_01535 [Clostridia bacterium]|nr:hypothetical protein [Clostridia bacterium]
MLKNRNKRNNKTNGEHSPLLRCIYAWTVLALPVLSAVALTMLSPVLLLAYFPIYECTRMICGYAFTFFCRPRTLADARESDIADDDAVLVVITAMLRSEEHDSHLFERLCDVFCLCDERNVFFGLLADIRDSKTAKAPGDEGTLSYAYGRINALNSKHGNKFVLLERRRSYSKSEEKFMGKDGRHGAVCELAGLLSGKEGTFSERSVQMLSDTLDKRKIRYLVVLSDDVSVGIGTVKGLCLKMMHPDAKPIVCEKSGVVTDGYAVIKPKISSPAGRHSLESLRETDTVYQRLSARDIFGGSGIIDVDAFHKVINTENPLPEDSLIDGDILIGERLRCGYTDDIELFREPDGNVFDLLLHRHKRVRGDIQALLCRALQGRKGKETHTDSDSLFLLWDRVITALAPIFFFACLICAVLTREAVSEILALCVLSVFALPFVYELLKIVFTLDFSGLFARFFSGKAVVPAFSELKRGLYSLAMLPMTALYSADGAVRACFRILVSRKRLLRDERCGNYETERGLLDFVHGNIFCAFAGFLLFAFAEGVILRLISVLWFAFPVIAYHCPFGESKDIRPGNGSILSEDTSEKAKSLWQSIADTVTEKSNNLPTESPNTAVTTPSEIGLYMLSVLCARDFGIIKSEELCMRLSEVLRALDGLEVFGGHFFARYDVDLRRVVPPCRISAKESAVLTACLITLKSGLSDYADEDTRLLDVIKGIAVLEGKTDYSLLYSQKHRLFRKYAEIRDGGISLSEEFLDNYMGTARLLAYITCAKRIASAEHYKALRKVYTRKSGYLGLLCDADDTDCLLPYIFLPAYEGTLAFEALHFHLRMCRTKSDMCTTALCELCNSALDGILRRRFMSDCAMKSADGLLREEIPTGKVTRKGTSEKG